MYVNERWCTLGHISNKEWSCTRDVELLVVSIRLYYLPLEFSHAISITVYILFDVAAASETIHTVVSQLQTSHPQVFVLIPLIMTFIMSPSPKLSQLLPSMWTAATGKIELWTHCMQTPRMHTKTKHKGQEETQYRNIYIYRI